MERKTKRLWIRISPEDEALFKRKAANYKSVSAMIRAAVNQLDDTATQGKIAAIHQLHDYYQRYQQQLSWLGGNFNQTVKRANELAIGKELTPQFFERELYPQAREVSQFIQELKRQLSDVSNYLTKL